ncbi:MAG TPA: bifunctional phosphopantothenoylcysteine decarboxylase/phosphopantothenate--cysteine ligase CoaBC [Patescibacteria group bacterium]|nr:bifunctional phosphopantothenoylcysteine decarboxylase/phosphopantothenate--cysteine ligase CoaBC [Patescibacteria group bacterium]
MANSILQGKRIILGVTGSIACYKAVDLASKLAQVEANLDVILTESAGRFVSPLSFQSVTGREAYSDLWRDSDHVRHVKLGESADLLLVAPATAHTLAKMAHGMADNLLTVTILAARCPILVAPAMDGGMYENPVTQANIELLQQRGVTVIGPDTGRMASGLSGRGRMVEPTEILGYIRLIVGRNGPLMGKHLVVTAGSTQEPLDPVRYLTNRSSGKQGLALAQAAIDAGATVDLISGPTAGPTPVGVNHIQVRTAVEMHDAVLAAVKEADILIMAAAVADFRPASVQEHKIKKDSQGGADLTIFLDRNPDVLMAVQNMKRPSDRPLFTVGFAAETKDIVRHGKEKMVRKGLDFIAINDVSASDAGFGVDTNRVILLSQDGQEEYLPLQSKADIAERIIEAVAGTFA